MAKSKKILVLTLLTSLIILATFAGVASVKAQTDSIYVYDSIGGTISANGAALTGGSTYNYTAGENVTFTATPAAGFKFLCFESATAAGAVATSENPYTIDITAGGAIQAMFVPTTNATSTSSQSGPATLVFMNSIGGETIPTAPGTYTNYTVGTVSSLTAVPGTGFKLLYWIIATSTANIYTSNLLQFNVTENVCAIQPYFVPTSSTISVEVTTPTPTPIPEFSSVATVVIVLALVAIAFGTYTFRRRTK